MNDQQLTVITGTTLALTCYFIGFYYGWRAHRARVRSFLNRERK